MIDPKDLAAGIASVEYLIGLPIEKYPPAPGYVALLAAAKAYQSAIASENEVLAAIDGYRTGSAGDSQKVAMRAALTAAKIKSNGE